MAFVDVEVRDWHFRYQYRREVDRCLDAFQAFFSHLETREMIKSMPKKELSWWFLHHLFDNLLGYELDMCSIPKERGITYLYQEKYGKSRRKTPLAEGVMFKKGEAKAVILLQSPRNNCFDEIGMRALWTSYHYTDCFYAIVSNFRFLRFYMRSALNTYEEFDLFNLTFPRFKVLYMLLHHDNLFRGLPTLLHEESLRYFLPSSANVLEHNE
jgi:hypothetical protein